MQTKLKATPGPWTIGSTSDIAQEVRIDAMRGDPDIGCTQWEAFAVCYSETDKPELGMQKALANARLIAAAPDLYATLSELEECCEYWSEYDVPMGIIERIKSSLKRARGEQ